MLSGSEAARLVAWYIGKLAGREPAAVRSVVGNEAWVTGPDALAILNQSLVEALNLYGKSDSSPTTYKGRTSGEVVNALRRRWGIDRFPDRAEIEMGGSRIGHSTLRNWERATFDSEEFQRQLEQAIASRLSQTISGDAQWLEARPSMFPPISTALESLLEVARQAGLGANRDANIQVIRQVVTMRVRGYFAAQPQHLIHHREIVESAWFRADVQFVEPVRGMLSPFNVASPSAEEGVMLRVSSAVLQLQYFLCLNDPLMFGRALQETAKARANFKMFLQRGGPQAIVVARTQFASRVTSSVHEDIDPQSPAGQAINLAYEVRAARKDERVLLVQEYVRLRRQIQPHLASYSEAYGRVVAQADQSVSHDAMDAMDEQGFREVDGLRTARGRSGPLTSYRVLTWRDKGVFASKRGRLADATRITDRGIDELLALDPEHRGDGHAFLESLHQHLLSNAGTAAKIVENLLEDVPQKQSRRRSIEVYERWARTSMSYAAKAHSALEQLDRPGETLPGIRHQDGFIASRDWWIQTRIMYLRAMLGAETLLGAVESDAMQDSDVNRGIMRMLYREIAGDQRLRRPRTNSFTQLAVWLAFVDGMAVPYVVEPSTGLAEVPFLTVSKSEALSERTSVPIDEERVVRARYWFDKADGWDRGPITRVRSGTAVAHYLALKSDHVSDIWLSD